MDTNDTTKEPNPESPEYLNEIAPKNKKAKLDLLLKKPIMLVGVALVIVLIFFIFAMIASSLSGGTKPMKTLSARIDSTTNSVTLASKNIQNTKLRALNSSLSLYLTNTTRDFAPILTLNNISPKNIDKSIIAAESNTKMLATLEDFRLNGQYDRQYPIEMSAQLGKILALMRQIYDSTKSVKTKTFLTNAIKNLEPIQQQFSDYNSPVS